MPPSYDNIEDDPIIEQERMLPSYEETMGLDDDFDSDDLGHDPDDDMAHCPETSLRGYYIHPYFSNLIGLI